MHLRRPSMAALSRCWLHLRVWRSARPVPGPVEEDVMLALALAPVQYMDFRAELSPTVSCSDVSEEGLGVSFSAGLTGAGR